MKANRSLLLPPLVLALLVVALVLPATALGADTNKPLAFASWGESTANRAPDGSLTTWAMEVRDLPGGPVGHLFVNIVKGEFPAGHYSGELYSFDYWAPEQVGNPEPGYTVAEATFAMDYWFLPGVYYQVVLVETGNDNADTATVYAGFDPNNTPGVVFVTHPAEVRVVIK